MNCNFCIALSALFLYPLTHVYDLMRQPKSLQDDGAVKRTICTTLSKGQERKLIIQCSGWLYIIWLGQHCMPIFIEKQLASLELRTCCFGLGSKRFWIQASYLLPLEPLIEKSDKLCTPPTDRLALCLKGSKDNQRQTLHVAYPPVLTKGQQCYMWTWTSLKRKQFDLNLLLYPVLYNDSLRRLFSSGL